MDISTIFSTMQAEISLASGNHLDSHIACRLDTETTQPQGITRFDMRTFSGTNRIEHHPGFG